MSAPWMDGAESTSQTIAANALALMGSVGGDVFDRIARLASRTLAARGVAVVLINEEWCSVLSSVGLAVSAEAQDCSWRDYVDAHGARTPQVQLDGHIHPAIAQSLPFENGLPVRASATQLIRVEGHTVGLLCAVDTEAREFSPHQLADLTDIAHWAEAELRTEGERRLLRQLDGFRTRTEVILASVAEGVVGLDGAGRCEFINPAGCALVGWEAHEVIGRVFHDVVHYKRPDGSAYPKEKCPVTEVLRTGKSQRNITETYFHRNGTPITMDWSVGAVERADGTHGAAVVFTDASERVEVEEMRDRFMSVVSHEMRTPLTSLLGALRLLDAGVAGTVAPEVASLLEIASRNGTRLARLIDDVLDEERARSGTLQLQRSKINVDELMAEAAHTVEGVALANNVRMEITPANCFVWGDRHRLTQVMTNLLGNAVRFSPDDGVVRLSGASFGDRIVISVADDGPGIEPHAIKRIFQAFWQVDASDTRAHAGSGLGLSIAHHIVALHGGHIDVDSALGDGTTFSVVLPVRSRDIPVPFDLRGPQEEQS